MDTGSITLEFSKQEAILNFIMGAYEMKPNFDSIMIIDDNDIDLFVVDHMLKLYTDTATVVKYESPSKALEYIEANGAPQVIILDMVMQEMNGVQFMEELKKIKKKEAQTKIILVSAYINYRNNLITQALRFPEVMKIVAKPLRPEVLTEIHEIISSKN
jgi:CheY-like chemotaxis protein